MTFEIAVAALRPPQRDSATPEGQGGIRLAVNHVTAVRTAGATGTQTAPLSIAITGDVRHYLINPYVGQRQSTDIVAAAPSIFVPIVPNRTKEQGNSLSLTAEAAYTTGAADTYSGLNGGVGIPVPAAPATYAANFDAGLVGYNPFSKRFEAVQWTSVLGGLQYYFPGTGGRMWLSGNVSYLISNNARYDGTGP